MRARAVKCAVVLALVLFGAFATRAEEPREARLPVRPFLLAQPDDWSTGVTTIRYATRSNASNPPEHPSTWRIAKVDADTVTVEIDDGPGTITTRTFPRRDEPTLAEWTGQQGRTFTDVKVEDDEYTWDSRDLAAKHVRFKATGGGLPDQEWELWISRNVRGSGVLASRVRQRADKDVLVAEYELRGHGNGDVAEAGLTPPEAPAPVPSHARGTVPAKLCRACTVKADTKCLACDGPAWTVPAKLCTRCLPRHGENACARCGGLPAAQPARFCHACAAGTGKDDCAKCSHAHRRR